MKRAFIVLLVIFALLAATTIQHTLNTPPQSPATMLGLIPVNDMVFALPAGIFAAGIIGIALGIGAEFWQAILPLCGADWVPTRRLSALADAALWCGWTTVGTCTAALLCIFPWLSTAEFGSLYTPSNYRYLLFIGIGAMISVRLFNTYLGRRHTMLPALICLGFALAAGQCWWNGLPIDFVAAAILLPLAVLLCSGHLTGTDQSPLIWLVITALALALYATGFSQLIMSYPTGPENTSAGWLSVKFTANTLLLLSLIILLTPALRKLNAVRSIAGSMALLAVILYNWSAVAAPLKAYTGNFMPVGAASTVYGITLICLSALMALRLISRRKQA